jgi:hypothetical protein
MGEISILPEQSVTILSQLAVQMLYFSIFDTLSNNYVPNLIRFDLES